MRGLPLTSVRVRSNMATRKMTLPRGMLTFLTRGSAISSTVALPSAAHQLIKLCL
jgi:hypothetical protein